MRSAIQAKGANRTEVLDRRAFGGPRREPHSTMIAMQSSGVHHLSDYHSIIAHSGGSNPFFSATPPILRYGAILFANVT
jgi:hypothetical protein